MQHNSESQLIRLMKEATEIAGWQLRALKDVNPFSIYFAGGKTEVLMSPPQEVGADEAHFIDAVRFACLAESASVAVLLVPIWTEASGSGDPARLGEPMPLGQECVLVWGDARERRIGHLLPVERSASGKFSGFGATMEAIEHNFRVWLKPLLPEVEPEESTRLVARAIWKSICTMPSTPNLSSH